jgi:hypothetical protein
MIYEIRVLGKERVNTEEKFMSDEINSKFS